MVTTVVHTYPQSPTAKTLKSYSQTWPPTAAEGQAEDMDLCNDPAIGPALRCHSRRMGPGEGKGVGPAWKETVCVSRPRTTLILISQRASETPLLCWDWHLNVAIPPAQRQTVCVIQTWVHLVHYSCFIHPFSVPAYSHLGRRGLQEPIPAVKRWEAEQGYHTKTDNHSHTHMVNLDWLVHLSSTFLNCWSKPECPEKWPRSVHAQEDTPHRKAGAEMRTPNLLAVRQQR